MQNNTSLGGFETRACAALCAHVRILFSAYMRARVCTDEPSKTNNNFTRYASQDRLVGASLLLHSFSSAAAAAAAVRGSAVHSLLFSFDLMLHTPQWQW